MGFKIYSSVPLPLPNSQSISYTFRRSARARRVRIGIDRDGMVTLTAPMRTDQAVAERFLRAKAAWVLKKVQLMARRKALIEKEGRRIPAFAGMTKKNKAEALRVVTARVRAVNAAYGFRYRKISVRNQKTRWGSCSRKGNLNFTYKLMFLPQPLQDYVIAHELSHLAEFNHSKKFWALVAKTVPNHLALRRELREKWRL